MGVAVSNTINLSGADVYISGKLVPAGDLEKLTVEQDTDEADACNVILATSYSSVVVNEILEVRGQPENETGDPKRLFFGKVLGVEPYKSKDGSAVVKIVALDHLSGVRLSDVPSPAEIVAYLGMGKHEYISAIARFLKSEGAQEDLTKVMSVSNVRAVLNAIPGGLSANKEKFAAKLKELLQLDKIGKRNVLNQMHIRAQEGPFPAIGGFRFVYFYPPQPKGTTVIVINDQMITVNK